MEMRKEIVSYLKNSFSLSNFTSHDYLIKSQIVLSCEKLKRRTLSFLDKAGMINGAHGVPTDR